MTAEAMSPEANIILANMFSVDMKDINFEIEKILSIIFVLHVVRIVVESVFFENSHNILEIN